MNFIKNSQQTFDLSVFSKENVTFLHEQVDNKNLFTIGYYHYFKIPLLDFYIWKYFLQILDFKKAYIILPILAAENTNGDGPILSLSKQILVTRDSNPLTIRNFLVKK